MELGIIVFCSIHQLIEAKLDLTMVELYSV